MAIALVQSNIVNESAGDGSVDATWSSTTTAGNLLIAVVSASRSGTVGIPAITAPAGWTQAVTQTCDSVSGVDRRTSIYYKANASAESGAKTWACDTFMGVASLGVVMAEYSGIATSTPLDQTSGAADTSTAATTCGCGTTSTTTQADELAIAAYQGGSALGSPSSSFTIQNQTGGANFIALAHKILSATGTVTTSATYSTGSSNAGAIATFKAAAGGGGFQAAWARNVNTVITGVV